LFSASSEEAVTLTESPHFADRRESPTALLELLLKVKAAARMRNRRFRSY
jgi:hypothetical protein